MLNFQINKKLFIPAIFGILTLIPFGITQAADWGKFQMIIPTRDPVQAGDKLVTQVIAVNIGPQGQTWAANQYAFAIEIYDENKNYLFKSDNISGDQEVKSGGSTLVFLPLTIPDTFSGNYFLRIGLTLNQEKIAYSDFIPFHVTGLTITSAKPPSFKVGGNAIFSYRNGSADNWKDYIGNTSINMMGSIYNKAFVFNLYTNHKPDDTFDIYNILFNYYGGNFDVSAGDIMPAYSLLSLSNLGMRGVYSTLRSSNFETSAVVAQTNTAVEGSTSTASGVYARYLYGAQEKITLPFASSIGLSYVSSNDDKNSISNPGPVPQPYLGNNVAAVSASIGGLGFAVLDIDFANSSFSSSTVTSADQKPVTDSAYSTDLNLKTGNFNTKLGYQNIGTDFNALGSPTIVKDRITDELDSGYLIPNLMNFSLSCLQYSDNLKKDQSKNTTTQKIYSFGTGLVIPNVPMVNLGYSRNDILAKAFDDTTSVENYSNVVSASVSKQFKRISLGLSTQESDFTDKMSSMSDNVSMSNSITTTLLIRDNISINLSAANSKVELVMMSTQTVTNTVSLTANYKIKPNKLVLAVWGTVSQLDRTNKDDGSNFSDVSSITSNFELTYYFNQQFAWTLGGGTDNNRDKYVPANSNSQTRFSTRISIGF